MDIIHEIEVLNNEVKQLNKKRDKLLWEKTRAEEELKNLLNEYNAKYGTALTPENVSAEFTAVKTDLENQYSQLRYAVDHINDVPQVQSSSQSAGTVVVNQGVNDSQVGNRVSEGVSSFNTGFNSSGNQGVSPSVNSFTSPSQGVQGSQTMQNPQFEGHSQFNPAPQIAQEPQGFQKRVGSMSDFEEPESQEPSLEDRLIGQAFDFSKYIGN